jgi:hypothetical protein
MGLGGQRRAWQTYLRERDRVPIVQGPSKDVWKFSPSPEFDPRTVQPAASRYADYPIPFFVVFLITRNKTPRHLVTVHNLQLIPKSIIYKSFVSGTEANQA